MKHEKLAVALSVLATTACGSFGSPAGGGSTPPGAGGSGLNAGGSAGSAGVNAGGAGAQIGSGGIGSGGTGADSGSGGTGTGGASGAAPRAGCDLGYSEHPNGKGGINVEAVCYTPEMGLEMEDDRRTFLGAMGQIKKEMVAGPDKNVYVEPIIWTVEWAQKHYSYPQERSN